MISNKNFDAVEYLMGFGKSGKPVTDLSRIKHLLEILGNPQKNLKFIHIAGTNGKGSVLEEISCCLIHSGYKTGQFTSPFIRRYNDRIRINNIEIDNDTLSRLCLRVAKTDISKDCSQFEITFAIALLWFAEEKCDICVLETGIGGLLDATNVIENPLISVITSISLDHMAILGDTIEKIAYQKAGIIKNNSACATDAFNDESVLELFKNECIKKSAEYILPNKSEIKILNQSADGVEFIYKDKKYKTAMNGVHQVHNGVLAIESLEYIKNNKNINISESDIEYAISNAKVEGRIQHINSNPDIYLDGGHNEDGADALCRFINNTPLKKPVTAIAGMISTKDYKSACEKFSNTFDRIICTDGFTYNAVEKEELAKYFDKEKTSVMNLTDAFKYAFEQKEGTFVFCGSLYLVSEILKLKDNTDDIQL